jgi:SAM-dependent methyltransferase
MNQSHITPLNPPLKNNFFLHTSGAAILLANYVRHTIQGYTDPRGFSSAEIARAAAYDFSVVASWSMHLREYTENKITFENKHVLELGPGADLGIGAIILAQGAARYTAFDKHNLISHTPHALYEHLVQTSEFPKTKFSSTQILEQIDRASTSTPDRFIYQVDPKFRINTIASPVDIVCSQAAFEHFDDIPKVARELSTIVRQGGILISEIGLQTHSRWIRDLDPLNIYRYSEWFYNLCKFVGAPNRLRPFEYIESFAKAGWHNIQIVPLQVLSSAYITHVRPHLSSRFQSEKNDLPILTFMLLATKS